MDGIALSAAHYSSSRFPRARDRMVTCGIHLLSTVIGKEIPMSSKQHRNLQANAADTEALESLQHMTTWARQQAAPMESRLDERQFGFLIDGFAIGATAFHPGPWVPPIARGGETIEHEPAPQRPSIALRAVQSIGHGAKRVWRAYRRRREIAGATAVLSAMDDRSLADIGISRADIGNAARHGRNWNGWR
jgi:uncharacterized protein YjiS (DUF1127 family)